MTDEAVLRPSQRLSDETLLEIYRLMLLSRRLDERAWLLHRQGRVPFHVSALGTRRPRLAQPSPSIVAWITSSPTIAIWR